MKHSALSVAWAASAALAAALLLCLPGSAVSLEWTLFLQPAYSYSTSRTVASNLVSNTEGSQLTQKYQLLVTEAIFPSLRLDVGAYLTWNMGWAETDGVWSSINTQLWDINARLSFGTQPLSGQAYFDGQEKLATSSTGGLSFTSPTVHQNTVGLTTTWNAADLPTISATIQHMDLFDSSRQLEDQSTNDLFVSAKYNPVRPLSLFYTGRFEAEDDRKAELTTNSVGNTGTVAYGDQFFGQRLVLSASYTLTGTSTSIHAANGSGQVPSSGSPRKDSRSSKRCRPRPRTTS